MNATDGVHGGIWQIGEQQNHGEDVDGKVRRNPH